MKKYVVYLNGKQDVYTNPIRVEAEKVNVGDDNTLTFFQKQEVVMRVHPLAWAYYRVEEQQSDAAEGSKEAGR